MFRDLEGFKGISGDLRNLMGFNALKEDLRGFMMKGDIRGIQEDLRELKRI